MSASALLSTTFVALAPLLTVPAAGAVEIVILYDNTSAVEGCPADWGFAALIDYGGHRILFDAGTKRDLFAANLKRLDVDPRSIEQVILSHAHADHTGGLADVYRANRSIKAWLLDAFPPALFQMASDAGVEVKRVTGPAELAPGVYTTGVVPGPPPEQALVIDTPTGLVMVVGCSHPGIVKLVETARAQRGAKPVRLVVGGFHMLDYTAPEIDRTIARLKQLQVESLIPSHCTGDAAKAAFRTAYGEKAQAGGAGNRIVLK